MELRLTDELTPLVESMLLPASSRVQRVVPGTEIHHVGATAVPGAVTKGDVDILLRVSPEQFPVVVAALSQEFEEKQRENWRSGFASFGDDDGYALPLRIQVVVRGSELDIFLYLRDFLLEHADALAEYNRLKTAHAGEGPHDYWEAKNAFLEGILATRGVGEAAQQAQ